MTGKVHYTNSVAHRPSSPLLDTLLKRSVSRLPIRLGFSAPKLPEQTGDSDYRLLEQPYSERAHTHQRSRRPDPIPPDSPPDRHPQTHSLTDLTPRQSRHPRMLTSASSTGGRGFRYKSITPHTSGSLRYRIENHERTTSRHSSTLWPEALKERIDRRLPTSTNQISRGRIRQSVQIPDRRACIAGYGSLFVSSTNPVFDSAIGCRC